MNTKHNPNFSIIILEATANYFNRIGVDSGDRHSQFFPSLAQAKSQCQVQCNNGISTCIHSIVPKPESPWKSRHLYSLDIFTFQTKRLSTHVGTLSLFALVHFIMYSSSQPKGMDFILSPCSVILSYGVNENKPRSGELCTAYTGRRQWAKYFSILLAFITFFALATPLPHQSRHSHHPWTLVLVLITYPNWDKL
jgi:hypothetical protein